MPDEIAPVVAGSRNICGEADYSGGRTAIRIMKYLRRKLVPPEPASQETSS